MVNTNAMLLCDTYKQVHMKMFDEGLTKLVSYWVPRKSMIEDPDKNKMVFFGLQAFILEYLYGYFDKNFFDEDVEYIKETFTKYVGIQIGVENFDIEPILALHKLGYLPLEIRALPEGSLVNMGIPCIELTNTHKDFAWLVQWIECILQAELWKICNHATIGTFYLDLAKKWYTKNADSNKDPRNAFSDFGMRGMSCMNEAVRCSAAWLLSANKTSTVCALPFIDEYYHDNSIFDGSFGRGGISTEHSVISSNYANGTDEVKFLKRMLTETYPNASFSCLGDTYDYWNFVDNVLRECKEEIMAHNGTLFVRPDSGEQVSIVVETVIRLYNMFGGTLNEKGCKVLDPHIGIILGDGCTLDVVEKIYKNLDDLGFSSSNVIFGIGAFCFSAIYDSVGGRMVINTRDTYGIAMKSTYAEFGDKHVKVFKNPKTDTSNLKKSHKGMVFVEKIIDGFRYHDDMTYDEYLTFAKEHENAMRLIFKDGIMFNKEGFGKIRERLFNGN